MSPHRVSPTTSLQDYAAYSITEHGFLPAQAPLRTLSNPYYQSWESVIQNLPILLSTKTLRTVLDDLPVLRTSDLSAESEWQRAYLILTMLAQGYIWQGPQPSERLPPAIAIPLLAVARHIQVLPVATYAALNLWNWTTLGSNVNITNPDNLQALHTFTGTDDESWFYIISDAMEARAGPVLQSMLAAMQAVERDDLLFVLGSLASLEKSLLEIGKLLERMYERCDPHVFYYQIRPFLAGSKNMAAAGLPHGVFFDEGDGRGKWRTYRGGSNGQSSLIQFFDAVLGVQHERTEDFHEEMRRYMPGPHARFLDDVTEAANIRDYVASKPGSVALNAAYNDAVTALTLFREKHMQLVSRYIIVPSRIPPKDTRPARCDLAAASSTVARKDELVGTGGTTLIPFLKQTRDDTSASRVLDPQR
ncbi:Indoleamine 2,3-dioxygenase [Sphaceloma murrayae]|uniref:Indoleamine 2,3-dioxygenase n=1 Tax=Sphaceloma murrayae TaxID=2082308 RepID=A0A2K1QVZ8_9PEZI|nr:Indoleamine 2,3-dioxygenase [Sphaceloma murrayae]